MLVWLLVLPSPSGTQTTVLRIRPKRHRLRSAVRGLAVDRVCNAGIRCAR